MIPVVASICKHFFRLRRIPIVASVTQLTSVLFPGGGVRFWAGAVVVASWPSPTEASLTYHNTMRRHTCHILKTNYIWITAAELHHNTWIVPLSMVTADNNC